MVRVESAKPARRPKYLLLAEQTGARLHIRQVTTAAGFDLIRAAKRRGVRVTCGITPAHLLLSDIAMTDFRTFAHLSPPPPGRRREGGRFLSHKDYPQPDWSAHPWQGTDEPVRH